MPRVMCVWFPRWPIQRRRIERPELSRSEVVLFSTQSQRPLVTECSPEAERRGVRVGQPLAEARTLRPRAVFLPADDSTDVEALRRLALECQRFSPLIGLDEAPRPSSILGLVDGCTHLWGGEDPFLQRVRAYWLDRDYRVHVALAGSQGAAWALARARTDSVFPPGSEADALSPLSVALLRLPAPTIERLHDLGLRTIGDILKLPRDGLASRFGVELPKRLDQALGRLAESLHCERLKEPIEAGRDWETPISDRLALAVLSRELLREIVATAGRIGLGVQELVGDIRTEFGTVTIEIRLVEPTRDESHLFQLLDLHLERRQWPGGVVAAKWSAVRLGRVEMVQTRWPEGDSNPPVLGSFNALIDRLASRLEPGAVLRARLIPDPQPEHAVRLVPWIEATVGAEEFAPSPAQARGRPGRLFRHPEPLDATAAGADGPPVHVVWRGQDFPVVRSWGPERIATGWWRCADIERDYYRIEWPQGTHAWVYRDRKGGRWFLHGFFD